MPKQLILKNNLSLGDIVMLTAAVRDLHRYYPGRFLTDVRTSCSPLWDNNPYLTRLSEKDPDVEVIECDYPLIHQCNRTPYHCLHGFIDFLNQRLGLQIRPTEFKGDIHLLPVEKSWMSQIHELTGQDTPFWIIVAGGKYDMTIKWWQTARYQQVVDHFRDKIQFVQVGQIGHYHPKLRGVIDLRGKTDLRQLVRLVYHSQGILCPVTGLMHLAAAVEVKNGIPSDRPCVVVAGGREPMHWEAYPHHQFIHTVGALPCCQAGGCWRSRTLPLRDGNERDQPENLCVDVVDSLPRCMAMIEPTEVIGRIELYFKGGALRFLSGPQAAFARKAVARTEINLTDRQPLGIHTAPLALGAFLNNLSPYPRTFSGRGIVISAQKPRSLEKARRMARRLGHLKCSLPIEIWYSTPPAMNGKACVYSYQIDHLSGLQPKPAPQGHTNCSGLKLYALRHCPFQQVLLLDAETVPLRSPESLFESAEFSETGAVFWPDSGVLGRERFLWRLCDIRFDKHEPELEGGQGLIDKERCWDVLQVAGWLNEHADFFYRYIRSEYEILHLAFRKIGKPFSMPSKAARISNGSKIQYGFQGHRSFLRRTTFERARRQAGGRSNYEWLRSLGWHQ